MRQYLVHVLYTDIGVHTVTVYVAEHTTTHEPSIQNFKLRRIANLVPATNL